MLNGWCNISETAETCKLLTNGPKCEELGWSCIPLVVETFGNWGKEAHLNFSMLASHIATSMSSPNLPYLRQAKYHFARELLPS